MGYREIERIARVNSLERGYGRQNPQEGRYVRPAGKRRIGTASPAKPFS